MSTYSEWDQRQLDIESGMGIDKMMDNIKKANLYHRDGAAAFSAALANAQIQREAMQLVNDLRNLATQKECESIGEELGNVTAFDGFILRARKILGDPTK